MEKSPLAVPFLTAMLSKAAERYFAKFDTADSFPVRERKWVIARQRVTEGINDLIETPPPCNAESIIALERLWVQFDDLLRGVPATVN
jgi:hypothetical protein